MKKEMSVEQIDAATLLLSCSGSILYGLNHAESDEDFYRVVSNEMFDEVTGKRTASRKRQGLQTIVGSRDEIVVSFNTFAMDVYDGVSQALEALFSPKILIDRIGDFRHQYIASTASIVDRQGRAAKKMIYSVDAKRRRHALRFLCNIHAAYLNGGQFSPTLEPSLAKEIIELAESDPDAYIAAVRRFDTFNVVGEIDEDEIRIAFAGRG